MVSTEKTEQQTYCERLEVVLRKLRNGDYDQDNNVNVEALEEHLKEVTYI